VDVKARNGTQYEAKEHGRGDRDQGWRLIVLFPWNNTVTGIRRLTLPGLRVLRLSGLRISRHRAALAVLPLWAALGLCAAQAQGPAPGLSPASFAGAVVSEWKGEVHVQLAGTNMSVPKRGQVLTAGTTVETGNGRLMLVLRADESEILVQPHTRLIVIEPAPNNWNALGIVIGRIRAYIRKRTGGAPPFQMGTPSAVIAVRGTRFDVEVNRHGVSEVDVFDGLVEVANPAIQGSSVLIPPGFSTRVGIGTPPEPPVPTYEIRPTVDVPEEIAKQEFIRERDGLSGRTWETEIGERADSEVDEAIDESRESGKENH
jgi:hypothetical protein